MSGDDAFLQAICENPEDDTHRLIYADWLEDRGDPDGLARAEFIRLQYLLAGHGTREQFQRESELLGIHKEKWLSGSQVTLAEWAFERGFLARAKADVRSLLVDVETFLKGHPLQHLSLFWGLVAPQERVADLRRLCSFPALGKLVSLDLTGATLGSAGAEILASSNNLGRLTTLTLPGNHVGDAGLRALAGSPLLTQLEVLDLSNNDVTNRGVASLIRRMDALRAAGRSLPLRMLDLSRNRLGESARRALQYFASLRNRVRA